MKINICNSLYICLLRYFYNHIVENQKKNNLQCTMKTEWVHKKLGDDDVAKIIMGQSPSSASYNDENIGLPFLQGCADFGEVFPKTSVYCNEPLKVAPQNSILMSVRAPVGTINKADQKYIIGRGLCSIVSLINNDYLYYYLLQNKNRLEQKAQGSTFLAINSAEVNDFDVSYPADLSTQRRIAAILASADKVIAATQKTIAKYKQIKQGMMEDLLKPKEGWEKVKFGEVGEVNPSNKGPVPDQFIYIDLESVIAGKLLFENYILKGNAPSRAQRLVDKNDVLYQTVRPYQRNNYIHKKQGNYVASTGYALIRCYDDYEPDFIFYLLHTHNFESVVLGLCTGTSYPAIAPNNLKRIEIAIPFKNDKPDLAEQRRIAAILSGIDAKIAAEEKVLQKYEKVKKGLMERLLEGNNMEL